VAHAGSHDPIVLITTIQLGNTNQPDSASLGMNGKIELPPDLIMCRFI